MLCFNLSSAWQKHCVLQSFTRWLIHYNNVCAAQVISDAAETLSALGKEGMQHRDVSTGNLIKYKVNGMYRGMLIDYQVRL
jgi:hypothetical protein